MTDSLTTARLILRCWRDSDRQPFSDLNADRRVLEFMPSVLQREARDELLDRIERHFERHHFGLFAAELRGTATFLGFVGLPVPTFDGPFLPSLATGWGLADQHSGQR